VMDILILKSWGLTNMKNTETKEKPGYYAILTADVRYCDRLKAAEKLMYAEITALSEKNGYCHAGNTYFANLYNVSKETVSRWVSNLEKEGFVKRQIIYKEGTKQIQGRYISIAQKILINPVDARDYPIDEIVPIDEKVNTPIDNKVSRPIDEKVKVNTTSSNTTRVNKNIAVSQSELIDDFYPNETSWQTVRDTHLQINKANAESLVQIFKDTLRNREAPWKDIQATFRTYVRKKWILPVEVVVHSNKPNYSFETINELGEFELEKRKLAARSASPVLNLKRVG